MADLVEVNGFQYKRATAEKLGLIKRSSASKAVTGPDNDKAVKSAPKTGGPVPQSPAPEPTPVAPAVDAGSEAPSAAEVISTAEAGAEGVPSAPAEGDASTPAAATAEKTTASKTKGK